MSRYLYITDVYCPWCYAFGLVFDKVLARYPMPVSVLCGELVSPGYTIDDMVMEMPNIRAFFKRLQDTAGRGVGKAYLDLLEPGKGSMSMDSRAMSVPVAALRRLDPGREREQIDALQKAFYQDGQDVLDPYVQAKACGVDEEALILECSKKEVQEQAEKDRQRAVDILGDFVIYPTLFLAQSSPAWKRPLRVLPKRMHTGRRLLHRTHPKDTDTAVDQMDAGCRSTLFRYPSHRIGIGKCSSRFSQGYSNTPYRRIYDFWPCVSFH